MAQAVIFSDDVNRNATPLAFDSNATPLAAIPLTANDKSEERKSDAGPLADGAKHCVVEPHIIGPTDVRERADFHSMCSSPPVCGWPDRQWVSCQLDHQASKLRAILAKAGTLHELVHSKRQKMQQDYRSEASRRSPPWVVAVGVSVFVPSW